MRYEKFKYTYTVKNIMVLQTFTTISCPSKQATMRFKMASSLAFAIVAAAATFVAAEDSEDTCGLYLAVSSTSTVEKPCWGLYAGKSYDVGSPVGFGDVAVQTFHLSANAISEDDQEEGYLETVVRFFEEFIWVPHSSGGQFELDDGGKIVTAISGPGVLGGYNGPLTNADWNHSAAYHREAWNEELGVAHPGRGAYSNFFDVGLRATQKIPVGMELFVNYGENWEEEEEEEEKKSRITREDHVKIDETVDKMIVFFDKHSADLDEQAKKEIYDFLVRDVMSAAAGSKKGAKIANALPETPDKLKEVRDAGGFLKLAEPTAVRNLEWLEQHGRCMDNIRPGPSTIPHAGRGAFANRAIPEGGLVSPVPLVQIPDEKILEMHEVMPMEDENEEEYFVRADDEVVGSQLLANYCLGHPESTLQFFPAGAVASFINHSPTPNAKLVWSDHPNNHKHWFGMDPEILIEEGNRHLGLLMEIVAIKDIEEGEEVFIDYGLEWAEAWETHVKEWEDLIKNGELESPWPTTALDLNQIHKSSPFEITDGAEYPENVMLKCFLMVKKPEDEPPINEQGQQIRYWTESESDITLMSENLFDCTIVDRNISAEGWLYTIAWEGDTETTLVKNTPHKAIVFLDAPGKSDQFVPQAFRHYIGIPDDVFPQGPWRNLQD